MKSALGIVILFLSGCIYKQSHHSADITVADTRVQEIEIGSTKTTMKWMNPANRGLSHPIGSSDTGYYYFNVKFERPSNEELSKDKTMYLDFDMQNDFIMAVKQDSVAPSFCQRIQNGRSGNFEYILAFQRPQYEPNERLTILYSDKMFGIGALEFVYDARDFKTSTLAAP